MNIGEASTHLRDILDVSDQRYPESARTAHLNQSIQELGREYETRLNEGIAQYIAVAESESFNLNGQTDIAGNKLDGEVLEGLWYSTSYDDNGSDSDPAAWTTLEKFTRAKLYPDYEMFMDSTGGFDSDEQGVCAVQRGNTVYMICIPAPALLRFTFRGPHTYLATLPESNAWLREAPWPVIYHAAMTACVWLEDEERIQVYNRLFIKSVEVVNIADSMRGDVPLQSQEA